MARSESRILIHLARGVEELLRAGSEAAAEARHHLEEEASRETTPLGVAQGLSSLLDRLEGPGLERLRTALRAEVARWSELEADDPAAGRVRSLFVSVLEVLEPDTEPAPETSSPPRPRAAPLRSTRRHTV